MRPQGLHDVEAAHLRHHEIEHDDVRPLARDERQCLGGLARQHEIAVSGLLEKALQDIERDGLVVDHHDFGRAQEGGIVLRDRVPPVSYQRAGVVLVHVCRHVGPLGECCMPLAASGTTILACRRRRRASTASMPSAEPALASCSSSMADSVKTS